MLDRLVESSLVDRIEVPRTNMSCAPSVEGADHADRHANRKRAAYPVWNIRSFIQPLPIPVICGRIARAKVR